MAEYMFENDFTIDIVKKKKFDFLYIDIESYNNHYTDNFEYHECWSTCEEDCLRLGENDEDELNLYHTYVADCNYENKECYGLKDDYSYVSSYYARSEKITTNIEAIIPIKIENVGKIFGVKISMKQEKLEIDYDDAQDACDKVNDIIYKLHNEINEIKLRIKNYEKIKQEMKLYFIVKNLIEEKNLCAEKIIIKKILQFLY